MESQLMDAETVLAAMVNECLIDQAINNRVVFASIVNTFKWNEDQQWLVDCVLDTEYWNEEVNQSYWDNNFDGDIDDFVSSISACLNEFYPIDKKITAHI